jgi:hypothetical protein
MKIDGYRVPDIDITTAQQFVVTIQEELGGSFNTTTEEELATAHGHTTSDSGAFRGKLSALREWGLIEGRGEKELTSLGEDFYAGEHTLAQLVSNIELYEQAHSRFGFDTPTKSEWMDFVEDQDITDAEESDLEKAWSNYNTLVRFCRNEATELADTPFDHDRFEKHCEKLQEERTRHYAINAIADQVNHPLPNIEPFEAIWEILDENRHPDSRDQFVEILRDMCEQSPELIRERGYEDPVYTFAVDILQNDAHHHNRKAVEMLRAVLTGQQTKERATELWSIVQSLLEEGVEQGSASLAQIGSNLAHSLIAEWASQEQLRTIEDDIWDEIGRDDEYDTYYESWLKQCQQELGTA